MKDTGYKKCEDRALFGKVLVSVLFPAEIAYEKRDRARREESIMFHEVD